LLHASPRPQQFDRAGPAGPRRRAPRASRRLRHALCLVLALALLGPATTGQAQISVGRLKSIFVERFTRFIEWPPSGLPAGAPFVVCVQGVDETAEDLFELARVKKFKERLCEVRRVRVGSDLNACHLLYIAGSEAPRLPQVLAAVGGKPILTVSDSAGFAAKGVLINLYQNAQRMSFEINLAAVKRSKLTFSSQLLSLGRLVEEAPAPAPPAPPPPPPPTSPPPRSPAPPR
jgi:hypothetical protein